MENADLLDDELLSELAVQEEYTALDEDEDAAEGSQEPETFEDISEGLTTGENSGEASEASSSSDGNNLDGAGTDTGSGTSQTDSSGTLLPDAATDTGTDALLAELLQRQVELQELQLETQQQLLVSNQRVELQFEACISILLIIIIVGALNYIYKFFKIFF